MQLAEELTPVAVHRRPLPPGKSESPLGHPRWPSAVSRAEYSWAKARPSAAESVSTALQQIFVARSAPRQAQSQADYRSGWAGADEPGLGHVARPASYLRRARRRPPRAVRRRLGGHAFQSSAQSLLRPLAGSRQAKKVAFVACIHKLLVILNAIARSRSPWNNEIATVV